MPRKIRAVFALIAVVVLAVLGVDSAGTSSRPVPPGPATATALRATPGATGVALPHFDQALEWPLAYFQAWSVWAYTQGDGVRVAVVDTGVDTAQPDLADAVDPSRGVPGDESSDSHGTAVAGIIAARGSPADPHRMAGLAPRALLIDVRVAPQAADVSAAAIANGILTAVGDQARIINVSLGVPRDSRLLDDAVDVARDHNCLVVASAGDGPAPQYPAALPGVLPVAAMGRNLAPATHHNAPAMYAPGKDLYSTAETGPAGGGHGGYITGISGSGYATAYGSAAAALLMSRAPWLRADDVRKLLIQAASRTAAEPGQAILDPLAALQELPQSPATSGPTPSAVTNPPPSTTPASPPAAAPFLSLRSAGTVALIVLAVLVVLIVIIMRLARDRGGPGTPSSLDVHF